MTPDWLPARPAGWARAASLTLFAALLLAAGYLRFDAGAPWSGRAVVAAAWALVGLGLWRVTRRTHPLFDRQLAKPGGHEEYREHLRLEWEALSRRGRRFYLLGTAAWLGPICLAALYSCAAFAPGALLAPGAAAAGGPPRFLLWLVALVVPASALTVLAARWSWERTERRWAGKPPAPPA